MADLEHSLAPAAFSAYGVQTIDAKNRLLIPRPDRDILGADFVAMQTNYGSIGLYRWVDYLKKVRYLDSYDPLSPATENYGRMMFMGVKQSLNCDPQGRVILPQDLLDRADIKSEVQLLGAPGRLEVWSTAEFKKWESNKLTYAADRIKELDQAFEAMRAYGRPTI